MVVITPRRSLRLRWLLRKLKSRNLILVTSPEPYRHGLSVGRVTGCWTQVITGDALDQLSAGKVNRLLNVADHSPDAGLFAECSIVRLQEQVIRVDSSTVLVRRCATNLCGGLDESFSDLRDTVDELAGRLTKASIPITAISVTDVDYPSTCEAVAARYPWMAIDSEPLPAQDSGRTAASRTMRVQPREQLSSLIDLSPVTRLSNGTGQHALRTLRVLVEHTDITLAARLGRHTDPELLAVCRGLGLPIVKEDAATDGPRFDVVLRVAQFDSASELLRLRTFASKVIVNHLDFIAFDNPTYHPTVDQWIRYRRDALRALHSVDGVAWLTNDVREKAITYGFRENDVPNAVCGSVVDVIPGNQGRTGGDELIKHPYIASFGASYHHKGRSYAVRVFKECLRLGWQGEFALIGWDPPHGSSLAEELDFLSQNPELNSRVTRIGALSATDHHAALRGAGALVQPAFVEGFGLLAAEAALLGVPTAMLERSALREVYGPDYPYWLSGDDVRSDALVVMAAVHDQELSAVKGPPPFVAGADAGQQYAHRLIALFNLVTSDTE